MKTWARGAVSGLVATVPMSAVMLAGQRAGWMQQQPPEALTEEAARRAGIPAGSSRGAIHDAAVASHFAFGAAAGVLYALLRSVAPKPAPIATGIGFGLGIWAASYRGWIPAIRLLPAEQHPGRRGAVVMIAAHVAYGATLGAVERQSSSVP